MRRVYIDKATAKVEASTQDLMNHSAVESRDQHSDATLAVCVVCCSAELLPNSVRVVAEAMQSMVTVQTVVLVENEVESQLGVDVIVMPSGTKLSKLRRLAASVDADLFCICDPDISFDREVCRLVLQQAIEVVRSDREVIAFGVVEGQDNRTLLSRVVALDKWLSHRVIRPLLWSAGIGITVPGQFLLVSRGVLCSIESSVDSYLDDLYLGWIARRRGACVRRVAAVVGQEEARTGWRSLLTQRLRWMRGIASLFRVGVKEPAILGLLGVHYFAYHVIPVLMLAAIIGLTVVKPLAGVLVFASFVILLRACTRRSPFTIVSFLIVFPIVHLLATLFWWLPFKRSMLTRR